MTKFASPEEELKHIQEALLEDLDHAPHFSLLGKEAIQRALRKAFDVGHRTTTSDDWVHLWD